MISRRVIVSLLGGSVLSLLALACLARAVANEWTQATPSYSWSFPRDHRSHAGFRTEWWYFTGHLEASTGERFGYQFTLFRIGLSPDSLAIDSDWAARDLVMGHAAISELSRGEHRFSELLYRATPLLGGFPQDGALLAWSRAPVGTDGRWTVEWNGEGFSFAMVDRARAMSFELTTRASKPLVLEGPNGFSAKGSAAGAASQYYSFTRLATHGEVTLDGKTYDVQGSSWMDKEFSSNHLEEGQTGWDWWCLQLDDGRELMLYRMRRGDDTDFVNGTLVSAEGEARYLEAREWSSTAQGSWKSEASGAVYPAGWRVSVPSAGLELVVRPELSDQENVSVLSGVHYWEGAVTIEDAGGRHVGQGYVELTGYGRGSRPPI